MLDAPLLTAVRQLLPGAGQNDPEDTSDADLLARFVADRDPAAFDTLLHRYGPMVLGVCRRSLGNTADAADAFQAVFLVLLTRAAAVRTARSVGSWLHGVACRVGWKMRATTARRLRHERTFAAMSQTTTADLVPPDLAAVLDDELRRLPEPYRAVLVLCYLEEKTHAEAAHRLGWPKGSVAKRVARGLELLRDRLARRGVVPAGAAVLTGVGVAGLAGAIPAEAAEAVQAAAGLHFAGRSVAGAVSARVYGVYRAVTRELLVGKLFATSVAAAVALGVGAVLMAAAAPGPDPVEKPAVVDAAVPAKDADGAVLPKGALGRLGTLKLRHGSPVTSISYSKDGQVLVSGSWDNVIRIWDAAGGPVQDIHPQEGWVLAVAASPDGKLVVSGGDNRSKKVRVWEVGSKKCIATLEGHASGIPAVAFAPDGKRVASGGADGTVRVWDVVAGKELVQFTPVQGRPVAGVVFTPDGTRVLAAAGGPAVVAWDAATGKAGAEYTADGAEFRAVAVSADGKRVAAGDTSGQVCVWEAGTGKELHRVRGRELPANGVAFAPDGKRVAAGYGSFAEPARWWTAGEVVVWETESGKMVRRLSDHTGPVAAVAFAPDGSALAATSQTGVLLWDPATGKSLYRDRGHQGNIQAAGFVGPERVVTASADRTVRVWDTAAGMSRPDRGDGQVNGMALGTAPAVGRFAWGGLDGTVRVCDANGTEIGRLGRHDGSVTAVAMTADGKLVASGGLDRTVRLWDVAAGKEVRSLDVAGSDPGNRVTALAFSPDGRTVGAGDARGVVRLWDASGGQPVRTFLPLGREIYALTFSPDGRTLATAGRDDMVRLWDARSGQPQWEFNAPNLARSAVAFSPDGRLLATATSGQNRGIRLWDLARLEELCVVWGHRGYVSAVGFSPDGKRLMSASDDSTVLVWDVATIRRPLPAVAVPDEAAVDAAWADLTGPNAAKAFRARTVLLAAPAALATRSGQVLRPVQPVDADKVRDLINRLGDNQFEVREAATAALERLGEAAVEPLREAVAKTTSAEIELRATRLIKQLDVRNIPGRDWRDRVLELLELSGDESAKKLLGELAKGSPQAVQTKAAAAALRRLGATP